MRLPLQRCQSEVRVSRIYHFADGANLPSILKSGELRCHRQANPEVDVGHKEIKRHREEIEVGCGPGGVVGDYVPFYYAPRSPMLFSIKCGNVEGVSSDQRRLVYFVSSTEAVYEAGLECVLTDGNAAAAFTTFSTDPTDFDDFIDWDLMKAVMWRNTSDDPDRRRRRMAEFLVHQALPLELVREIAVKDKIIAAWVIEQLEDADREIAVAIRPEWYF